MNFKTLIKSLLSLFYPEQCVVCKDILVEGEKFLCLECIYKLPKTNHHLCPDNMTSKNLIGKVVFNKAFSYLYYNKGGMTQSIVAEIKYKGNRSFGIWLGSFMASDIMSSGFFEDIDFFVPVPLHKKKLRKRGFNQAEIIAQGLSNETGIPLNTSNLYRSIANPTQTKKGSYERWLNTQDIFAIHNPSDLEGKHLLLIDDVFTTGSTVEACIEAISKECKSARVSVLAVAVSC